MKLEITKEKVLEAASKCSQAKETLKTLFPEVFEDDKYFDLSKVEVDWHQNFKSGYLPFALRIRNCREYAFKGFALDVNFNWEIVTDSGGYKNLIPTKK